jgi:hypothetical protein
MPINGKLNLLLVHQKFSRWLSSLCKAFDSPRAKLNFLLMSLMLLMEKKTQTLR